MSQNHHIPSSACAAFAPLLPLAGHDLLNEADAARLRAHLATCAHCQAALNIYDQVEVALRRSFAPRQGARLPFSREEIMQTLDHQSDHPIEHPTSATPPIVPAEPPRRARRFLAGFPALAAALAIVLIAVLLFAAQFHGMIRGSATTAPTPARGSQTWLRDISMISPTEGWAVGYGTPADDANNVSALLMHYTHGAWSTVHTTIKGRVEGISMVSATDGWAVGDQGLLLHYNGKTWRQVAGPTQEDLLDVHMLSAADGWIVGGHAGGAILHYDGQKWTPQPLPASLGAAAADNIGLESLSMISPTEGWIVGETIPQADAQAPDGSYYATKPPDALILHYLNGRWTLQNTFKGASLRSVSMVSAADGWAAGNTDTYVPLNASNGGPGFLDETAPLLLHYTSGKWEKAPNPAHTGDQTDSFTSVFMSSATDGWLNIGVDGVSNESILLHYNGASWQQVSLPSMKDSPTYSVFSIAMTSPTEGWAVGANFSTRQNGIPNLQGPGYQPTITPLILHYLNGAWRISLS